LAVDSADGVTGDPCCPEGGTDIDGSAMWHLLQTWVFTAKITNEFILRLDVLQVHDPSIDLSYRD
jgi:hypothetical protein